MMAAAIPECFPDGTLVYAYRPTTGSDRELTGSTREEKALRRHRPANRSGYFTILDLSPDEK